MRVIESVSIDLSYICNRCGGTLLYLLDDDLTGRHHVYCRWCMIGGACGPSECLYHWDGWNTWYAVLHMQYNQHWLRRHDEGYSQRQLILRP